MNRMKMNTPNMGINPLMQAQMMNELKYRQLYEEERARNEDLEHKMENLIERIERHTENNMKIKSKYSKEIEGLMYQNSVLERELEELRLEGGSNPEMENELRLADEKLQTQNVELENLRTELATLKMTLERERNFQGDSSEQVKTAFAKAEAAQNELIMKDKEIAVLKEAIETSRSQMAQEKNDVEMQRYKLQLSNDHWQSRCEQMEREIQSLKENVEYEKRAKLMMEDKINVLEKRLYENRSYGIIFYIFSFQFYFGVGDIIF